MDLRKFLFLFFIIFFSVTKAFTHDFEYFSLDQEPFIRIGLSTNARSVSITTSDISLVAISPNEPNKLLATNRITVSSRAYRPPVIDVYQFEIQNIETREEAESIAKDVRGATGEKVSVKPDIKTNLWSIRIGESKETAEEAEAFRNGLAERGFADVVVVTEKKSQPSEEALALSEQNRKNQNPKNEIRSLISPTGSSQTTKSDIVLDPNVKEIVINGKSEAARFSSFKPIAFGSVNERAVPVRLNGKAYRGRIEVFVNSRGTLTVVNVVPVEDYLLGVVPKELGLPSLEAQKAQAVAARTYAIANIGGFANQGFDLLPTVWSQVYGGVSAETVMGTQAVLQTRGIIATYRGKPINALYTSTCGGRTENVENIFDFNEPYLRGVECSLEGRRHFAPFLIKSSRELPKIENEDQLETVRLFSQFAVNGFVMTASRFSDEWLETPPNETELRSWLNQVAFRFGKPAPAFSPQLIKGVEFAKFLASMLYAEGEAEIKMTEADINYHLSFADSDEIDAEVRAKVAMLFRDGWLSLYPDAHFHPHRPMPRSRLMRLIQNIYAKKKWLPAMQTGTSNPTIDGKLIIKSGRSERQISVNPNVYLFRQFGDRLYPVKEVALVGGESVSFFTNTTGEVVYLEVQPTQQTTVAEKMSPFSFWNVNLSASAVQARLSRYVRGIGTLYDMNIKQIGVSHRPIELEIIGSNGTFTLKGGKIRSALRLREQLFVMNKRYDSNGRVASYSFIGRGWGHGVGMCQYGAFGLGKMGLKYDAILKHYYTGIDLTKAY
jgi:stage II sporulation protein D